MTSATLKLDKDLSLSSGSSERQLCDLCSSMTVTALRSMKGYKHQLHTYSLQNEFDSNIGCALCSLMWERLQKATSAIEQAKDYSVKVLLNPGKDGLQCLQVFFAPEDMLEGVYMYCDYLHKSCGYLPFTWTPSLSRRVLICKQDQFAWECQNGVITESGVGIRSLAEARLQMTMDEHSQKALGISKEWHSVLAWQFIMTDCSARSLSQTTDKLIAIAGLAKEFASIHGWTSCQYVAGLWTHGILDHLLWAHQAIDVGRQHQRGRPSDYRAPSW